MEGYFPGLAQKHRLSRSLMEQILSQNSLIVAYMHCLNAIGLVFATTVLFGFQSDPWRANELFDAATIATELKSKPLDQPLILQVGFQSLYKSVRIPQAKYAGPGSTVEGMANLEQQVKGVAKDRAILIYCGCCPWEKCPNIRPTVVKLHELGFTRIQVLKIPTNLHTDWVEPGYPVERAASSSSPQ
jgi:thiosulfate/3-mercaptopyruvate sulfurtransferase